MVTRLMTTKARTAVDPLPPAWRGVLRTADEGAFTAEDPKGRICALIKLPPKVVLFLREPLSLRHFLFMAPMPTAAIIGWFFGVADSHDRQYQTIALFNIAAQDQLRQLKRLKHQDQVEVFFVDGKFLEIVFTKQIYPPPNTARLLEVALNHASEIAYGKYSWSQAVADFKKRYSLNEIATWQSSDLI